MQRTKEFIKYNEEQLFLLTKLSHIYCSPILFAHKAFGIQCKSLLNPAATGDTLSTHLSSLCSLLT